MRTTLSTSLLALGLGACCAAKPAATTTTTTPTPTEPTTVVTPPATPPVPPVPWDSAGIDWSQPPAPTPDPAFTPPVAQSFALKNGIRVVLIENHRLPLFTMATIHMAAGSRDDGAAFGLASLTGDLLDEGAGKLDADGLAEELEHLGARLSIDVGADSATITTSGLVGQLGPAIDLAASVVQAPRLTQGDFDRLKADTLEQLEQRRSEPRPVAALVFGAVVYGSHPYAHPAEGFGATVGKLTLADAKAFWQRAYAPASTTIVIAGDLTRAQVAPLLDASFGGWRNPATSAERKPPVAGPAVPTIAVVDRPGAPQSMVFAGRRAMAQGDAREITGEVINMVMGGSYAARLNHRLRQELGYTYGVTSSFVEGRIGGVWAVRGSYKTENTGAALAELVKLLDVARTTPVPADELAKAKHLMVRGLPQSFETTGDEVGTFAALVRAGKPLDWYAGWSAQVDAVTAEQAQAVASAFWAPVSFVIVGDWAAIHAEVEKLGLPIVRYDADGRQLP